MKRENYPPDEQYSYEMNSTTYSYPGHTITFVSPVELMNLLPYDINYALRGIEIKGEIRAGKKATLFAVQVIHFFTLFIYKLRELFVRLNQ